MFTLLCVCVCVGGWVGGGGGGGGGGIQEVGGRVIIVDSESLYIH